MSHTPYHLPTQPAGRTAMRAQVLDASVSFIEQPFVKPLQLSSGLITGATEARVSVRMRVNGKEALGRGSIYLSDLWAWPGATPSREQKNAAMRSLCEHLAATLGSACGGEPHHPLELGLRLHHTIASEDFYPQMPLLARSVCMSPFDAAIHDATGIALGKSAFSLYSAPCPIPSADALFQEQALHASAPADGTIAAIAQILRPPAQRLNAWWVVSAQDDLTCDVQPQIARNGIRCFKIKVIGKDIEADAQRTAQVYRASLNWGQLPQISIDSNEGNADAGSVAAYLDCLERIDKGAFEAVRYLEQPTGRDISRHAFDWHAVSRRKPVLLDEGLTRLDLLPLAREQGWSGLALKTCKGHSVTLVAAAWARRNGMQLALQDLTNPGFGAIHSYLLGTHIDTCNGVELNSPQYTPAANAEWLPRLRGLFEVRNGIHTLPANAPAGLGSLL